MGLAFFVFVVVAGTIIGGYFAVTILPQRFAARKLDLRLRDRDSDGEAPSETAADLYTRASPAPIGRAPRPRSRPPYRGRCRS